METLCIALFGTLRLQRTGEPVAPLPTRRSRELLSYLLINRKMVCPREQLAAMFWPEVEDQRARHCLNTALWRLQRALLQHSDSDNTRHPYLRIDAQNIGFNLASEFKLDIAEFEDRCTLAEQVGPGETAFNLYRQAVELYRADLLIDCYEDWCIVERDRLSRLYVRALIFLVTYLQQRGEYQQAIEHAHRLLAIDPAQEDVHRRLIELHMADSQPAAALRQYHACVESLNRELGVAPMPETSALLRRILNTPPRTVATPDSPEDRAFGTPRATATGLVDALARLEDALATFDHAIEQLRGAAVLIEDLGRDLAADPSMATNRVKALKCGLSPADLSRVTQMIGQVARQLGSAGTLGPSRTAPPVLVS